LTEGRGGVMKREIVAEKVMRVISEILSIDRVVIRRESLMVDDLGCDSVHAVEIMLMFEDMFSITIPQSALAKVNTVDDIINYIMKKTGRK
jgi:acyl carrier protein